MIERLAVLVSAVAHRPFAVYSLLSPDIRHINYLEWVVITQIRAAYMYLDKKSCFCVSHKHHVPTSM